MLCESERHLLHLLRLRLLRVRLRGLLQLRSRDLRLRHLHLLRLRLRTRCRLNGLDLHRSERGWRRGRYGEADELVAVTLNGTVTVGALQKRRSGVVEDG